MIEDTFITDELEWLAQVIVARMKLYFKQECEVEEIHQIAPPPLEQSSSAYCSLLKEKNMSFDDRVFMILAWVPYLKPQLLDCFMVNNSDTGRRFIEFGCVEEGKDGTILPTLATALFILAGDDLKERLRLASYFTHHSYFASSSFLQVEKGNVSTFADWVIHPSLEQLDQIIFERPHLPQFSSTFPATIISTTRSWAELVLSRKTLQQIEDIKLWLKYGEKVRDDWELAGLIKPGFRALFYGPSGTGKTFTVKLLGKELEKPVFSIDMSMVVSKYIGETEKNLSKVFDMAENKDWILFFDEADALFGKRTNIKDSHDRYANQEVAYLLQRVEDYRGLVILSTNLKSNIDEAFARRFQIMVPFNLPNSEERARLWKGAFSKHSVLEDSLNLDEVAELFELSGGSIVNVVQYCSMMAMSRGNNIILKADLLAGVEREYAKVGKILKTGFQE